MIIIIGADAIADACLAAGRQLLRRAECCKLVKSEDWRIFCCVFYHRFGSAGTRARRALPIVERKLKREFSLKCNNLHVTCVLAAPKRVVSGVGKN